MLNQKWSRISAIKIALLALVLVGCDQKELPQGDQSSPAPVQEPAQPVETQDGAAETAKAPVNVDLTLTDRQAYAVVLKAYSNHLGVMKNLNQTFEEKMEQAQKSDEAARVNVLKVEKANLKRYHFRLTFIYEWVKEELGIKAEDIAKADAQQIDVVRDAYVQISSKLNGRIKNAHEKVIQRLGEKNLIKMDTVDRHEPNHQYRHASGELYRIRTFKEVVKALISKEVTDKSYAGMTKKKFEIFVKKEEVLDHQTDEMIRAGFIDGPVEFWSTYEFIVNREKIYQQKKDSIQEDIDELNKTSAIGMGQSAADLGREFKKLDSDLRRAQMGLDNINILLKNLAQAKVLGDEIQVLNAEMTKLQYLLEKLYGYELHLREKNLNQDQRHAQEASMIIAARSFMRGIGGGLYDVATGSYAGLKGFGGWLEEETGVSGTILAFENSDFAKGYESYINSPLRSFGGNIYDVGDAANGGLKQLGGGIHDFYTQTWDPGLRSAGAKLSDLPSDLHQGLYDFGFYMRRDWDLHYNEGYNNGLRAVGGALYDGAEASHTWLTEAGGWLHDKTGVGDAAVAFENSGFAKGYENNINKPLRNAGGAIHQAGVDAEQGLKDFGGDVHDFYTEEATPVLNNVGYGLYDAGKAVTDTGDWMGDGLRTFGGWIHDYFNND